MEACESGWVTRYRAPSRCKRRPLDERRLRSLVASGCRAMGAERAFEAALQGIADCSGEPLPEFCQAVRALKTTMIMAVTEVRPLLEFVSPLLEYLVEVGVVDGGAVAEVAAAAKVLASGEWSQRFDDTLALFLCQDMPQFDEFETGGSF